MKLPSPLTRFVFLLLAAIAWSSVPLATSQSAAQTPALTAAAVLHGQVADQNGAVIPQAAIAVTPASGKAFTTTSDGSGAYEVRGLPAGSYIVTVVESGFATFTSAPIALGAGQTKRVDVAMAIEMAQQQVTVTDETPTVSLDSTNNANSLVLKGKDLDALSDDPDELSSELTALAGPSAGPNGGQIYIDGFTGGQLPPKSAIREIRVNQNPFSAEYDRLGYGRIEILTKPGTDKLHGQFFVQGNSNLFNSKNPFACTQATRLNIACTIPDYHTLQYDANVSDALGKHASIFANIDRRNIQDNNIVNAVTLGGTDCSNPTGTPSASGAFTQTPCSVAVQAPSTRTNGSARFDLQLGEKSTVTLRYQYEGETDTNSGIGQFNLLSRAYNLKGHENTLEFSETQVINPRIINETHARFQREIFTQTPFSTAPGLSVSGAFYTGGNGTQNSNDAQTRYELQNYTSLALNNHSVKFGGRLRATHDANLSTANSNGIFTFGSRPCPATSTTCTPGQTISALEAFQITQQGLASGEGEAAIRAAGGGASQYSVNVINNPSAIATVVDAGLYVQDEWKVRPNFSFSSGLRWESQNHISNISNFAPRIGFAYGVGGGKTPAKTVIRGGYGFFYDRFRVEQVLQAERESGLAGSGFTQTVVINPDTYPNPPALAPGSGSVSTIYQIDPRLHSPYTMQFGIGVDRQLGKIATMSVTYLNSRGIHQLVTRNANAPTVPGYDPALGNIYQYYSQGIFKQNQLIVNFNVRAGTRLSLFGFYQLGQANSDTSGVGSFAAHPENLTEDYGRAAFSARNRLFVGGTLTTKYNFRLSPFLVAASGNPYNITTSQDLNGDSIFNDRPSFSGSCASGQVQRSCFNANPGPSDRPIPVNYANGPSQFTFNLRASKTIGIGPKIEQPAGAQNASGAPAGGPLSGGMGGPGRGGPGGGGRGGPGPGGPAAGTSDRRYNLTFNVQTRNLFNNVNYATPSGQLDSPLFGKSNALGGAFGGVSQSANRRIDLQAVFSF